MTTMSRFAHRMAAVAALALVALLLQAPVAGLAPSARRPASAASRVYLPLVSGHSAMPDLVVTRLQLMPPNPTAGQPVLVQIALHNLGDGATSCCFWTDLYVDPAHAPVVNQPWPELSRHGAAWRSPPLVAGETALLYTDATGDPDRPGDCYANFTGFDTPGVYRLYVLVDSYAPGQAEGKVAESNEGNNGFGPFRVVVSQ